MKKSSDTFKHKKSFGQNFLINPHVRNKIIEACDLKSEETVLEIGPGEGALTEELATRVKKVIAIEKDYFLAERLQEKFKNTNVNIIQHDILTFDFNVLPKNIKAIGNLPYNIATPIIERIINHRRQFQACFFMLQLEHGQRLIAQPDSKDYGSLSCFVQYYAKVKKLFNIKNTAFYPKPKVESCFLRFDLWEKLPHQTKNEEFLFNVIRTGFSQRRKTISNTLADLITKKDLTLILERLKINPQSRAENLTLENYIALSELILQHRGRK